MVQIVEDKKGKGGKVPIRTTMRSVRAKAKAKATARGKTEASAESQMLQQSRDESVVVQVLKRPRAASVIAKGRLAKFAVFRGDKERTRRGLRKTDLVKNKQGKIVSRTISSNSMKVYSRTIGRWTLACTNARRVLGLKGFVPVRKGRALYEKARQLYDM